MTGSNRSNAKIDKSVSKYLDQLHDQYSKVLALRVDVGYSKEHSQEMSLDEIKRDIKHLLNNRRSNRTLFEHQVGYVLKYEYTPCKGPHVHGLFPESVTIPPAPSTAPINIPRCLPTAPPIDANDAQSQ